MAEKDLRSAKLLEQGKEYNQAVYFYIQYMEKKIKASIANKINPSLPYYAKKLREIGHSLDKSILFLIEILSGDNENVKLQLERQLLTDVFEDIVFSRLYNQCRYPSYHEKRMNYSIIEISQNDCKRIRLITERLDKFLKDFYKL